MRVRACTIRQLHVFQAVTFSQNGCLLLIDLFTSTADGELALGTCHHPN